MKTNTQHSTGEWSGTWQRQGRVSEYMPAVQVGWVSLLQLACIKPLKKEVFKATFALIAILGSATSAAFDPSKMPEGLYYNGTNSFAQLWTPLFLAQQGQLIDPFVLAKSHGLSSLSGRGKTLMLKAVTPFLYGGCATETRLRSIPAVVAEVPTVAVQGFGGKGCQHEQDDAFSFYRVDRSLRGSNPFPTLYLDQRVPGVGPMWIYGVPGMLVGQNVPVAAHPEAAIGARPAPVNGVATRMDFVPLPVIGPHLIDIALAEKKPLPKYPVSVLEAAHRSTDVVVTPELLQQVQSMLQERLWQRYYPRLAQALDGKLGGIARSYFELGLIQGVDLDNQRSYDYIGVARVGAITKAGPWRWVDVVYCWRKKDDSFSVIATSEEALYEPEHRFFSEKSPSLWAPSLLVSGFSDFDKDKQLEVILSLLRPYGTVAQKTGDTRSEPLTLRQNFLYVWSKSSESTLVWTPAYRTVVHEESFVEFEPKSVTVSRFGE